MIEIINNWIIAIKTKILGVFDQQHQILHDASSVFRKRSNSETKFDKFEISSDEESDDYAEVPTKRPRIDQSADKYIEHRPSTNAMYATWVKPRSGFSNCYTFSSETLKGDEKENQNSSSAEENNLSCKPFNTPSDHPSMTVHKNSSFAANQPKHSISSNHNEHKVQSRQKLTSLHCKDSFNAIKHSKHNGISNKYSSRISKRGFTAQHCIQLEERENYRQLLQCYVGYNTSAYSESSSLSSSRKTVFRNYKKDKTASELPNGRGILSKKHILQEKLGTEEQKTVMKRILNERSSHSLNVSASKHSHSISENTNVELNSETLTKAKSQSQESVKIELDDDHSDNSVIITKVEPSKWRTTMIPEYNQCFYMSPDWLKQWKLKFKAEEEEKKLEIEKVEKNIKMLKDQWSSRLEDLELDIREQLRLSQERAEVIKESISSEEEEIELLPELTPEMEDQIDEALHPHPPDEVLVEEFRLQIRRRDMETLQDQNWLNDEVINFYMNMLMERGKQDNMPSVYACNTFFYPKLISGGHGALKRWTRKIDIFAHDIMLVPVHLGVHWCLAVINFKACTLKYYDSMGGKNNECLHALCEYLKAESLDKKKQTFDMTDWIIENAKDIPQQMNSSDCGMFACKYAEYLTRNSKITFKQEHMPYFRRRMVYEIISKKLM